MGDLPRLFKIETVISSRNPRREKDFDRAECRLLCRAVEYERIGAVKAHPLRLSSDHETKLLKIAVEELKENERKGVSFASAGR